MDRYTIKVKESALTERLPINFRNKMQKHYDNAGVSGSFNTLPVADELGFKFIYERSANEDIECIQDRVTNGESLSEAILGQFVEEMLFFDAPVGAEVAIRDIVHAIERGEATIEPGFISAFVREGLVGGLKREAITAMDEEAIAVMAGKTIAVMAGAMPTGDLSDLHHAKFNASPWLEQASDNEIEALFYCGLGKSREYATDEPVEFARASGDADVCNLYTYLEQQQQSGTDPSFDSYIDEASLMDWLQVNKPHLVTSSAVEHYFNNKPGQEDEGTLGMS